MPTPQDPIFFELSSKVQQLTDLLLSKHPMMPTLLREIHTTLRTYPEQVTLLSEEQISQIVQGLKVQTGVEFAASVKAPSATKNLKNKIATLGADAF